MTHVTITSYEAEGGKFGNPAQSNYSGANGDHDSLSDLVDSIRFRQTPERSEGLSETWIKATHGNAEIISDTLSQADIANTSDRGQVTVETDPEKVAAFRLGQWAQKNFSRFEITKPSYGSGSSLVGAGGEAIKLSETPDANSIKEMHSKIPNGIGENYGSALMDKTKEQTIAAISDAILGHMPENNDEQIATKTNIKQDLTTELTQRYKALLTQAKQDKQQGSANLKALGALAQAGHISAQQLSEISEDQITKEGLDAAKIYDVKTSSIAGHRPPESYNTDASDAVSASTESTIDGTELRFDHLAGAIPQLHIIVPEAQAAAYKDVLQPLADAHRQPAPHDSEAEYFANYDEKAKDNMTRFTIEHVDFDRAMDALTESQLMPESLASSLRNAIQEKVEEVTKEPAWKAHLERQPQGKSGASFAAGVIAEKSAPMDGRYM